MKRKLQYLIVLLTFLPFINVHAQLAPPIASFAYDPGIDTVWINSPYTFVNTSTYDVRNYWRVTPVTGAFNVSPIYKCHPQFGCFIDTINRAFKFKFENVGTYKVTLVTRNNLGVDSTTKLVYVGLATKKPKANFFIDKYIIGNAERIPLYDLSQNGPTEWEWYLTPKCYICNDPNQANNDFLPSPLVQTPSFFAQEGGKYGICLIAKNAIGVDTFCRPNYVEVISGTAINSGIIGPLDTLITTDEGYLYDNGGPAVNYYNRVQGIPADFLNGKFYTIAPCASKVTLTIEQFRFRTNDSLLVHDISKTGPILARLGGPSIPPSLRTITSNSGRIVLEWKCGAGEQQAADSGFVMKFTSVPATYGPPKALFTCPDVVYSGYNVKYTNQSTGQGNLFYAWDADGLDSDADPFNNTGYESDLRDGVNFTFINTGIGEYIRNICLLVTNCKGTSQFCKLVRVRPIVTGPVVNFSSPRPAGFTTDVFKLFDETKNGALTWKWTITPNTVTYVQGTNSTSQNPVVRLNAQGQYNVKLAVSNTITITNPDLTTRDSIAYDSLEKPFFLSVIAYNRPDTENPIASGNDIGITRVSIPLAGFDTTTNLKTPIYDTIFARKTAVLYRGVDYKIEVSRNSAVSPMDRKVWVDTSLDGTFLASGELIYSEVNKKTLTAIASFRVPNYIDVGRVLRMRVGISEANSKLTADMASSGCFEDYSLEIGLNQNAPLISLKGDSVFRMQLNKTFNDPGITANDDIEGDISDKYESITNLDITKVGFYYKKYYVRDLYDNVSDTVYRVIQVEINRNGPKLALNANDTIYVKVKEDTLSNLIAKPTATDYLGNIMNPALINRSGYVDSAVIGNYMLTWVIKDEFALTDTVRQRIFVRDITAPTVITTGDTATRVYKHQIGTAFDSRRALLLGDNYYSIDDLTVTRSGSVNENAENS
ncbi:MAG: immunoglobulin-like domain-containing protein, partial [Bacteroidota bacterium]